jgi:Serine dehydratase beta chain.
LILTFTSNKCRADGWESAVGPSSSHTVGPMRAGKIFIADLKELDLLEKV